MANTTNSAYMILPIPVVGVDPGPQYASDVNTCLTLIDGHTHSPGSGTQVTPSGLNINSVLPMNGNGLNGIAYLTLTAQGSTPANGTIYESGVDLYYVDGSGNNIQITQSGGVAGSPGSISNLVAPASAAYVALSSTFVWQSGTNIPAYMDGASVILRNFVANSKALTLNPPNSMASNYALTLPALPAQTNVMTLTTAGAMSSITYDQVGVNMTATGANAISNKVTRIVGATAPLGGVATSPVLNFSTSSTSYVDVTNSTITITTNGNPLFIGLVPDGDGRLDNTSNGIQIVEASGAFTVLEAIATAPRGVVVGTYLFNNITAPGTYSFKAQLKALSGTITLINLRLVAYEL